MQTTEMQIGESEESPANEYPYFHSHEEIERLERISKTHGVQVLDTKTEEKFDVVEVRPLGVIIEDGCDTKMITYEGRNNLKSDRYRVVVS